jgi:hypothetical protein
VEGGNDWSVGNRGWRIVLTITTQNIDLFGVNWYVSTSRRRQVVAVDQKRAKMASEIIKGSMNTSEPRRRSWDWRSLQECDRPECSLTFGICETLCLCSPRGYWPSEGQRQRWSLQVPSAICKWSIFARGATRPVFEGPHVSAKNTRRIKMFAEESASLSNLAPFYVFLVHNISL